MPRASKTEEPAGASPVPGKPQSQVDAEAEPDAETAAAWQEEYDSRVPAAYYDLQVPEPEAEEHESGQMAATDAGL